MGTLGYKRPNFTKNVLFGLCEVFRYTFLESTDIIQHCYIFGFLRTYQPLLYRRFKHPCPLSYLKHTPRLHMLQCNQSNDVNACSASVSPDACGGAISHLRLSPHMITSPMMVSLRGEVGSSATQNKPSHKISMGP